MIEFTRVPARSAVNGNGVQPHAPPKTRTADTEYTIHNTSVRDPYSWLADSDSIEVKRWTAAQQNYARKYLDSIDARESIIGRLRKNDNIAHVGVLGITSVSLPSGRRRYFQYRQKPGEEYKMLYYRDGICGKMKVAIDPNKFSRSGNTSLIDYFPYYDGTMVAFTTSFRGSDVTTIRILDLESGRILRDKISNVTFADVVWTIDKGGFYYTKWPDPKTHENPKRSGHVYFHKMGTDQSEDLCIFGKGLGAERTCGIDASLNMRHLFIYVSDNFNNEVYYKKLARNADQTLRPLITGMNTQSYVVEILDRKAYVLTNLNAPNYRIVNFNIDRPDVRNWRTVIKECDNPINSAFMIDKRGLPRFVVQYLNDVHSDIALFSIKGRFMMNVELPFRGSVEIPHAPLNTKDMFFSISYLTKPPQIYRFDTEKCTVNFFEGRNHINMEAYEAKQIWYQSNDGAEIPMFLLHRKGIPMTGNNPVLLYGYGGFGISSTPDFNQDIIPFIEDGGIYAIANIRGGGEYGSRWYEQGMHKNQQQSIDDFIAAAEYLIGNGYTRGNADGNGRMVIRGRSQGGYLVAVAGVKRPDLFAGVISEMPLTDLITADRYDIGPLCKREYGDINNPDDFRFMLRGSAYHNVRRGTHYPAFLVIGGENDTRCDPMHYRKFGAALQNATASENPVIILTQRNIGHGGSTMPVKRSQQLEWTADWLAFAYEQTGMAHTSGSDERAQLQQLARTV